MKTVAQKRKRNEVGQFVGPQEEMIGVFVSQARAYELSEKFEIYFSHMTGFYVRTDNISRDDYTYHIYKTGDQQVPIPANAYRFSFEISLPEASREYEIPYSTLAEWARGGKLDARRSGSAWLTTRQAVERLIFKE